MIEIENLVWDEWNITHIARHDVTKGEVEEAFIGLYIARESYGGRYLVLGQTEANRVLAIVIHPKPDNAYYVVTARSANRQERSIYQAEVEKGGEQAA